MGLDLSGDPKVGDAREYMPLLLEARDKSGLYLSIHLAEVPNHEETKAVLEMLLPTDRVGHGTCIHPDCGGTQELWELLLERKIPVEACPSSNLLCGSIKSVSNHQSVHLLRAGHPVAVCTDDRAVFGCELSGEYYRVATEVGMDLETLAKWCERTVDFTFLERKKKEQLRSAFQKQGQGRNDPKVTNNRQL